MRASCSLIAELGRVFNAKRCAIECLLRHGQITVDGYTMRQEHDERWAPERLKGRMAAIHYYQTKPEPTARRARLYQ